MFALHVYRSPLGVIGECGTGVSARRARSATRKLRGEGGIMDNRKNRERHQCVCLWFWWPITSEKKAYRKLDQQFDRANRAGTAVRAPLKFVWPV
jgi:hypothetical protein